MKASDPVICLEAGTEVLEDYSQTTDQKLFARVKKQGGGHLDVAFADIYFFPDAAAARKEALRINAELRKPTGVKSVDEETKANISKGENPFDNFHELRGNVLVDYNGTERAQDKSLVNGCLSEAGAREEVSSG